MEKKRIDDKRLSIREKAIALGMVCLAIYIAPKIDQWIMSWM